ncbi:MAG: hypothetical protein CL561_11020 [Alphaproteobacteria bacterium]|nr:hypothetical protein [Alphaproteobacteria bacterium]|tara:strand:+ start:193665 stop:194246 length:582 start_codon:yes stop_codon:yes gene_type:complete
MNIKQAFVTVALPVLLSACASQRLVHQLNDECLHKVTDEDGNTINVAFDEACGNHKRELARLTLTEETEKALKTIDATQQGQIQIINQEKTKIFWQALAQRAAVEIGNPHQEDTATRLLIAARNHEDPEIRKLLTEAQQDLGITNTALNDKNATWDKIREAQATPGIQIIDLGNGEFYMDKYKHSYGPLSTPR